MITAKFIKTENLWTGFQLSGHADYSGSGNIDIVCACTSSAVQLTANTLTEIFRFKSDVQAEDNLISLSVNELNETADKIIAGLKLHLELLSEDFPKTIKITILEV